MVIRSGHVSDATDPNMATMQAGYAANIISSAGQEMLPPGVHAAAIVPQLKLLYNPQMKSAYNFVPGVMGLILMLICAMMTSISIVREKETNWSWSLWRSRSRARCRRPSGREA